MYSHVEAVNELYDMYYKGLISEDDKTYMVAILIECCFDYSV
jgi:hypothetical protein